MICLLPTKRIYQYLATFSGLLAMVASGMFFSWPSPSLPQLSNPNSTSPFHITSSEGSSIAIMQLLGSITSCFYSVFTTDLFGRKKSMLFTAIPMFIAWWMTAYADSTLILCIARFLAGLGDGTAFAVMPLYIGEIADPEIRGFLGVSISGIWISGMLLINVIGSYWSIKVSAIASSIVPLLMFASFMWMPESPYWLIMKQNYNEARKSLVKFKGDLSVDSELERLKEAVKLQTENNSGKFLDLFTKKENRNALIVIAILRNTQQLSGITAITFYTQSIFMEAGGDFISPIYATIILLTFQFITSTTCSIIIDRTGRKILLIISTLGSALMLFLGGTYFYLKSLNINLTQFSSIPLISLVGFVIIFNIGCQPMPLLMIGELFPTNVKAFASGISEIYFSASAVLVAKFFQIINDEFGMYLPFYVFAACCVLNLGLIVMFVPETKGKTLEEVQEGFKK